MNSKSLFTASLITVMLTTVIFLLLQFSEKFEIVRSERKLVQEISNQKYLTLAKKKQRSIYLLKTHKRGSTTMYSMLMRFGYRHNLTFAFPADPTSDTISRYKFQENKTYFLDPPVGERFDILCHHTTYDRRGIKKILPTDTKYIGIVRDPLSRFVSSFIYFRHVYPKKYLTSIEGNLTQAISSYLETPSSFEPKMDKRGNTEWSHTNNGMAYDFGFPLKEMQKSSSKRVSEFINRIDAEFDLVIVLEFLDESLVLMKRMFSWSLKDILYLKRNNVNVMNTTNVIRTLQREHRTRHQRWEFIDYALYNHFLQKTLRMIKNGGNAFQNEVDDFRSLRLAVNKFCDKRVDNEAELSYRTKHIKEHITVNLFDCTLLRLGGRCLTNLIKQVKKYPSVTGE